MQVVETENVDRLSTYKMLWVEVGMDPAISQREETTRGVVGEVIVRDQL